MPWLCTRCALARGTSAEALSAARRAASPIRSTDPKDYAPLRYSHNAQLDHGGDWLMCPRGHVRITWGTDPDGGCRGCRRERLREHKRRRRADPEYRARENARNQQRRARRRGADHRAASAALSRSSEQQDTGQTATTKGTTRDEPR